MNSDYLQKGLSGVKFVAMLIHNIRLKSNPDKKKTVSEFAWNKKYGKTNLWEIFDTKGKVAGAVEQAPSLPPTQFAPPAVVRLNPRPVAPSAEPSASEDPVGAVITSETQPIPVQYAPEGGPVTATLVDMTGKNSDVKVEPVVQAPKARTGRPRGSKNKTKETAKA